MKSATEIQEAVDALDPREFKKFRRWFLERVRDEPDHEIAAYPDADRGDRIIDEASADKTLPIGR